MYLKLIRENNCFSKDLRFSYQKMPKEKKHTPLNTFFAMMQK